MEVSATSTTKKTSVGDKCGSLILKARSDDEAELLAAINYVFAHGGVISAKPKGGKPARFDYVGWVNEPDE